MRNLLLRLSFDGRNYSGFQIQNNGNTLQAEVQSALKKVTGQETVVYGCSRTDAGVSAKEFYLNFFTQSVIETQRFPPALNFHLPDEISVNACVEVGEDFNARADALKKEYIYIIHTSRFSDPFLRGFCHEYGREIDVNLLQEAANHYVGTHDFSSFVSSGATTSTSVRTVYDAKVTAEGDYVQFKVSGNGFLYNMVRIMVGTLLWVNEGKFTPDRVAEIINAKDRTVAGPTAPAEGLFLNKVYYKEEILQQID